MELRLLSDHQNFWPFGPHNFYSKFFLSFVSMTHLPQHFNVYFLFYFDFSIFPQFDAFTIFSTLTETSLRDNMAWFWVMAGLTFLILPNFTFWFLTLLVCFLQAIVINCHPSIMLCTSCWNFASVWPLCLECHHHALPPSFDLNYKVTGNSLGML